MSNSSPAVRVHGAVKTTRKQVGGARHVATEQVAIGRQDLLEDSLAYTIRRAQVRCDEILMRYLDAGISPARLAALSTVGSNPGISQRSLGELLSIAAPSVVKVVDDLEKMALLRRDKINGRLHALQLTKRGVDSLDRYRLLVSKFESEIAARLTVSQRKQLLALLEEVAQGIS